MSPASWWLVWADGSVPRVRHASEISARREAERLAREKPGTTFYVLQAKSSSVKTDVLTTLFDDDTVPF